jgi:hypothetical protein
VLLGSEHAGTKNGTGKIGAQLAGQDQALNMKATAERKQVRDWHTDGETQSREKCFLTGAERLHARTKSKNQNRARTPAGGQHMREK